MEIVKLEDYKNIYAVDPLADEYKSLFGKSYTEYKNCLEKLKTNLSILDHEGLKKALTYQQFEKVEGEDLYSIRYVSKSNPRVIFAYVVEGSIILLAAFKEKKKSDYQNAINKAKDRIKELEE